MKYENTLQNEAIYYKSEHPKDIGIGYKSFDYMHYHDQYEIILLLNGQEELFFSGNRITLHQQEICILRPFEIHQRTLDNSKDLEQVSIAIKRECFDYALAYLGNCIDATDIHDINQPFIKKLLPSESKLIFEHIKELYDPNEISGQHMSDAELKLIIMNLLTLVLKPKQGSIYTVPTWLQQLSISMDSLENLSEGLPALSRISGKSSSSISHAFKKYYNTTPTHFINEKRVKHAAMLLTTTNDEIIDICYKCGFGSLSYFYNHFRKTYAVSPLQYRKSYQNL